MKTYKASDGSPVSHLMRHQGRLHHVNLVANVTAGKIGGESFFSQLKVNLAQWTTLFFDSDFC